MIKIFCDHCGEEITRNANELDGEDLFWDGHGFVGMGSHLCEDCYDLRTQKLIEFDRKFLNLDGDSYD